MEIIIEEKTQRQQQQYLEPGGLDPFKDFKLPTFTRQPQPLPLKPQQPQLQKPQHPQPREPFKQPTYHQKYQQTYKTQSQPPKQPPLQKQQQQAFSYDNILHSLNMKVNDGKLEYMSNTNSLEKTKNKIINHYFQNQTQRPQLQPQQQQQQEPQEQNPTPMTREEHQRRLAYYYWQQQEQRKRISQIKSKKMLYPTENIQISTFNKSGAKQPLQKMY